MARIKAFTLVELLVVVTIITLLIGLMLPSISKATAVARRVTCASNLHQLESAHRAYMADHMNFFMTLLDGAITDDQAGSIETYHRWAGKMGVTTDFSETDRPLNLYLGGVTKVTSTYNQTVYQIARCPADNGMKSGRWTESILPTQPTLWDAWGISYRINSGAINNNRGTKKGLWNKTFAMVVSPSTTIFADDETFNAWGFDWVGSWPSQPMVYGYWHDANIGWGNLAFVDGHIDYKRSSYTLNPINFQSGPGWNFIFNGK